MPAIRFHPDAVQVVEGIRGRLNCSAVMLSQFEPDRQKAIHQAHARPVADPQSEFELSISICKQVMDMKFALVVDDAASHALVKDFPQVRDGSIGGYMGVPVRDKEDANEIVAVLCALSDRMRRWSSDDLDAIRDAAGELTEMILPSTLP